MKDHSAIEARLLASNDLQVVAAVLLIFEAKKLVGAVNDLSDTVSYHGGMAQVLREMTSDLCQELGRG